MEIQKVKISGSSFLVNDTTFVPNAAENSDYRAIQAYIANGGVILPEFSDEEILAKLRSTKISQLAQNRYTLAELGIVSLNDNTYANSQSARTAISSKIIKMTEASPAEFYPTYPVREITFLTREDFITLSGLIDARETSLRMTEITLINQINTDILLPGGIEIDYPATIAAVTAINIDLE